MAQAGFTPISLYFSSTASAVPSSGNLANGELALNIADMKLYAKNSAGVVTLLASNSSTGATVSSVAVSGGTTGLTTSGGPITSSGTITLAGTLGTANGGTNLTSFSSGGLVYASSSSALATNSVLTFNGTSQLVLNPASGTDTYILAGASGIAATYIGVNTSGSTNGQGVVSGVGYLTVSGGYPLVVTTNGVERIRATAAGNVGISTSSPNFKTHISTGSTTSITQPTAGSYGLYVQQNTSGSVGGIYIQDGASNSGPSLFIADNNGLARFIVDTDGNVGIGVTAPTQKAEIAGTLRIKSANADANGLNLSSDAGGIGYINAGYASVGAIALQTAGVTKFYVGPAGQFGIGTSPSYGTSGQVLTSGGSGAAPTWTTAASGAQAFVAFGSTGGL